MNERRLQAQSGTPSTGSVIAGLGSMLREFNRTAEAVLHGLRDDPVRLASADEVVHLNGTEQLRELRAAMPRRVLSVTEGLVIAERQAALLRWQIGAETSPALATALVVGLPFLTVTYRSRLAKSGLATKTARGWVIVLRGDEPNVRQRFSLAHEVKHVLDDEQLSQFPEGLYRTWGNQRGETPAERVCDHFSACLLMPKLLLRRDWVGGLQDPVKLARRYQVSRAAMEVRLRQLGLVELVPRCGTASSNAA
jgi:Zn-dependent peptidase ImmA (M78 family)